MHELQGSHTPKAKPFIVSINGLEKTFSFYIPYIDFITVFMEENNSKKAVVIGVRCLVFAYFYKH